MRFYLYRYIIEYMPRTKGLIVASLALVVGLTLGFFLSGLFNFDRLTPVTYDASVAEPPQAFKVALETIMQSEEASTAGGFTPDRLLKTFPGLQVEDFSEVAAVVGRYEVKDGTLVYTNTEVLDEAAADLSDEGYLTLRINVYRRFNLDGNQPVSAVLPLLRQAPTADTPTSSPIPPATDAGTVCTQDVRECPDGSYVSRQAPGCAFAACPSGDTPPSNETITCEPGQRLVDMCTEQYAPVCAAYQVQCVTTPCNPVPRTYSNSCFACMDKNVISYSEGACVE